MSYPIKRGRRLRSSAALRAIVTETHLNLDGIVCPIFVEEEIDQPIAIPAMPGVDRIPETMLAQRVKEIAELGIRSVILFGVSHHKDDTGSDTWNPNGLISRSLAICKKTVPDLITIADVCFCEYTIHGHCGILDGDKVDNDKTLANLAKQAVNFAKAGADIIAPSAMMDGQVSAIRNALDQAGFSNHPIMAYSSKHASCYYGPFRDAAGSSLKGDRKSYQMNPANFREAMRESLLDVEEGADILLIKPALPALDVIAGVRSRTDVPIAAYQVSGEYACIKFAAAAGAIDERAAMFESLGAIKRAGADIIITYFAEAIAKELGTRITL